MTSNEIVVASDTHIAKVWNHIDNVLPSGDNFLNPNTIFKEFISGLDKRQKLIINGDIIDYYKSGYIGQGGNNWNIFFDYLKECKSDYFLNLGNHDYRSLPYNFSIYGMRHVNLSNKLMKKYSKLIGYNHFRFLKELNSFLVNQKKMNTLYEYPFSDYYAKQTGNKRLLMLNSGPDAFTRLMNVFNMKNWLNIFADPPSSLGLDNAQMDFVKQYLNKKEDKDVFLFMHHPMLFHRDDIDKKINFSFRKYHAIRRRHKLSYGIILQNNKELMEMLVKSKKNIFVVSSHTHTAKQYSLDKEKMRFQQINLGEANDMRDDSNKIKFLGTLPMGAVQFQMKDMDENNRDVGYMKIGNKIEYKVLHSFK